MPGPKETRAAVLAEIARLKASLEAAREQGSDVNFSPEFIARTERAIADAERALGIRSDSPNGEGPRRLRDSKRLLALSTGTASNAGGGNGTEGTTPSTAVRSLGREESQRLIALSKSRSGTFETPERDVGIAGAFAGGVKTGILDPFSLFGSVEETEGIDETGEKVANAIGTFVGLGISFVPFALGSKLVLQGVGLASKVAPPVEEFLRYTLAGTLQGVGTADSLEEVPKEAAIGLAFGLGVDGFFLAKAMRGRADDVLEAGAKIVDNGSVIPDKLASTSNLSMEVELAPTAGKSAGRLETEAKALANDELRYPEIIAGLTEIHETTVRIPELDSQLVDGFVEGVRERFPQAQILTRNLSQPRRDVPIASPNARRAREAREAGSKVRPGVSEVLIHNPLDPGLRLTDEQISQWQRMGSFEGMGVIRDGKWYQATGVEVEPGFIQLRGVNTPHTFATKIENVTIPISPRMFGQQGVRVAAMQQALRSNTKIGFTIGAQGARGASAVKRGVVDTAEYAQARSYQDWLDANRGPILSRGAVGDVEEGVLSYAQSAGIKGLLEVEGGIIKNVRIFDQSSVKYVNEPPRLLGDLDAGQLVMNPDGSVLVESFQPTWKNTIIGPLRVAGFAEKEIKNFLESQAQAQSRSLESLMDDEFKAAAQASRVQFGEGCF